MKEGLKQKLNDWIKSEDGRIVRIDAIERQVKLWGYKISNAERRLRDSESPDIGKLTHNGAIIGYFWRNGSNLAQESAPRRTLDGQDVCCFSYKVFKVHARDCETLKEKVLF